MNPKRLLLAMLTLLFYLLFAGGVISYAVLDAVPPETGWAGPLFLYTAFAIVLISSGRKVAAWLCVAFAGGIAAELIGLHTGLLFGDYTYTAALGGRLLGVPVAIGAAWGVLLAYASALSMLGTRFTGAVFGALWMVAVDLLIDPLAGGPLGYWQWNGGGAYFGVPLANFAGWFIVSFILLSVMPRCEPQPRAFRLLGISVVVFYGLLALAHSGLQVLAIIAVVLALADWAISRKVTGRPAVSLSGFGRALPSHFTKRTVVEFPADQLFEWHARAGAFESLKPPWQKVEVVRAPAAIQPGEVVTVVLHFGPVRVPWTSEIVSVKPELSFTDVQVSGPWAYWRHEHNFISDGENASVMEDRVEYIVPGGVLGDLLGGWLADYELHRLFNHRHRALLQHLAEV